jgi:hypothetical protein
MGTLVKGNAGMPEEENPTPPAAAEEQTLPVAEVANSTPPVVKPEAETAPEAATAPPETHEPPPIPVRLCAVAGYDGRVNDIVYCPPSSRSDQNKAVIYFGGDVQVRVYYGKF